MLTLARYALKGPYQAATVIGILAILALFAPLVMGGMVFGALLSTLLSYLAASLVGLVILAQGVQSGFKAIMLAVLGLVLVSTIVLKMPQVGLSTALIQWLPIILLAHSYRVTRSLALTLIVGIAIGMLGLLAQYLLWPNLAENITTIVRQPMEAALENQGYEIEVFRRNFALVVHWLLLTLGASLYLLLISIILTARWLQIKLLGLEPRQEFLQLSLGKPASIVMLAMLALSLWLEQDWVTSLMLLTAMAFLFQGIAVVHVKLSASRHKSLLLALFYLLLAVSPQVIGLTVVIAIIDNWIVFRKTGIE